MIIVGADNSDDIVDNLFCSWVVLLRAIDIVFDGFGDYILHLLLYCLHLAAKILLRLLLYSQSVACEDLFLFRH